MFYIKNLKNLYAYLKYTILKIFTQRLNFLILQPINHYWFMVNNSRLQLFYILMEHVIWIIKTK